MPSLPEEHRGKSGLKVEVFLAGKNLFTCLHLVYLKINYRNVKIQTNMHARLPLRCKKSRRNKFLRHLIDKTR